MVLLDDPIIVGNCFFSADIIHMRMFIGISDCYVMILQMIMTGQSMRQSKLPSMNFTTRHHYMMFQYRIWISYHLFLTSLYLLYQFDVLFFLLLSFPVCKTDGNHHPQNLLLEERVLQNLSLLQMVDGVVLHKPLNMLISMHCLQNHLIMMRLMMNINLNPWTEGMLNFSFSEFLLVS